MFKKIDRVEIVTGNSTRPSSSTPNVLGFTVALRERLERSSLGVLMSSTALAQLM